MGKSTFALTLLAVAASGAQATVMVSANSSSMAQAGSQPVSSSISIKDGVVLSISAGPNGTAEAGPIGAGVTSAYANTSQISVPLLTVSTAYADLATGTLRNYVQAPGGPSLGGSIGIANSRWIETVTFNNTSGQTVDLGISWLTEGAVTDSSGPTFGSQNILSGIFLSNVNSSTLADIQFKDNTPSNGGPISSGARFTFDDGTTYFTSEPAGGNLDRTVWTTTLLSQASAVVAATLMVPKGLSAITVDAQLRIDCRTGAICDFGNTASFSFGALPTDLSWSSESGVFLTAAVPEPETYAMLLAGLGLMGAVARRKKSKQA